MTCNENGFTRNKSYPLCQLNNRPGKEAKRGRMFSKGYRQESFSANAYQAELYILFRFPYIDATFL